MSKIFAILILMMMLISGLFCFNNVSAGEPPGVPTKLTVGMDGLAIHITCAPMGGDIDAVAYYRSVDGTDWKYRGSHLFDWFDPIGDVMYSGFWYKARAANQYGFSAFCEPVYVSTNTNIEQVPVYDSYAYPMFDYICGEPSLVMVGNTLHAWFASGPTLGESTPHYLTLWHTTATNATFSNWAAPVKCTGDGLDNQSRFPFVLKEGNTYYLFNSPFFNDDVYLWSSSNGVAWSPMNGGNPIINKSASNGSIYYNIWNVGVVVANNIWHMWIECGSNVTQDGAMSAYTWGTIDKLDWQAHLINTPNGIQNSRNVCPAYVAERNAFIIFSAKPDPVHYPGQPYQLTYIGVYTVKLSDDLYNPTSYKLSPYYRIGNGEDVSDAHVAFTGGVGDFFYVIQYFSNDAGRPHIYQLAGWMDDFELYDLLVNGFTVQKAESHVTLFMSIESTGIIWLIIYFIVVLILSLTLGKLGLAAGLVIMGVIVGMAIPVGVIVSIFSVAGAVIILYGGVTDGGDS